jgi:hypothetical protein
MIGFPVQALFDLKNELKAINAKLDRLIEIQLESLRRPSDDPLPPDGREKGVCG